VKAIEVKPSKESVSVVHHATASAFVDEDSVDTGMVDYEPHKPADVMPDGTAILLKAGSKLRWNIHYAPNSETRTDRTTAAFKLYPKGYQPKNKAEYTGVGVNTDFDLPAGESNIRYDGYTQLKDNMRLVSIKPHLHVRGKRQCVEAILSDGRVQPLNCMAFDFNWHMVYKYADAAQPLLPRGTVLHVTSWFDNSAASKGNPDPENWSGWGNRSTDEMGHLTVRWFALSDSEFAEQVAARFPGAKSTTSRQAQR
jgi:hypothetical protein